MSHKFENTGWSENTTNVLQVPPAGFKWLFHQYSCNTVQSVFIQRCSISIRATMFHQYSYNVLSIFIQQRNVCIFCFGVVAFASNLSSSEHSLPTKNRKRLGNAEKDASAAHIGLAHESTQTPTHKMAGPTAMFS